MPEIINFLKITIGSCKFMQLAIFLNKFVCTVLTDLQTRFCGKLIYIYIYLFSYIYKVQHNGYLQSRL